MKDDYLSSYLREYVLQDVSKREIGHDLLHGDIDEEEEKKWILTDARNPLGTWQDAEALDHWKGLPSFPQCEILLISYIVMRTILPDYVWSTY